MKALIVVALLCTVSSLKAEPSASHAAAALAAAGAFTAPQITPNTVRSEKVNACVQQRLNLAKSSFSPYVGGPTGSTSDYK